MATDEAFLNAGVKPGLEIWRIEKLKVIPQEIPTYGKFYTGDSYIVLSTKKPPNANRLEWDIHFWLGADSSQDEQGIAAYKSVELDDSLGGGPVQHREVQEHETSLFASYFKKGITYLSGGVDSGFRKVERDKYDTRLLHVKGKRNVRVRQVKCEVGSLNQGDVFILDQGLTLYVWNGTHCSNMERIKAAEVARTIKDEERGGRATIIILDESNPAGATFYTALGCPDGHVTINTADEGGDDVSHERDALSAVILYRVSDASGKLEVTEVASEKLKRTDLDSDDCFILDSGRAEIYAWVGKHCTRNEKKSAWQNAMSFLTLKQYPQWTQVTQLVEGAETPLFKQFFSTWPVHGAQRGLGQIYGTSKIATYNTEKFNATGLHQRNKPKKPEFMPDDGSGEKQIWRIEYGDMIEVAGARHGVFYTGDCYIILYTYTTTRHNYILYFWQGAKSSIDEKAASAILTQRLDDVQLNGAAVQIRVTQGSETNHFLRLFDGKMTILFGGINNVVADTTTDVYHIRGTNHCNTRAIQVPARASSLNSNDVFIVRSELTIYKWLGKGSSEDENDVAKNVLNHLFPGGKAVEIKEGEETAEFWGILGGEEPYAKGKRLEASQSDMPTRLFQCSNASGRFLVEEIVDFTQEDLVEDDVMLLDTFDEVFVWIGTGANDIEKKEALTTAMEYIRTAPSGRSADTTPLMQVKQGHEPPNFTGYFHAWDPDRWSHGKSYEDLKRELGQENVLATRVQEELACYDKTYTYEELISLPTPKGVDVTNKEKYLSDDEFKKIFKITKQEYLAKSKWRQLEMKKRAGLF